MARPRIYSPTFLSTLENLTPYVLAPTSLHCSYVSLYSLHTPPREKRRISGLRFMLPAHGIHHPSLASKSPMSLLFCQSTGHHQLVFTFVSWRTVQVDMSLLVGLGSSNCSWVGPSLLGLIWTFGFSIWVRPRSEIRLFNIWASLN